MIRNPQAKNFTKRVYKAVLSIPLGEVRTYKWVAAKAGNPKASRAVGQVLKKNPFLLIIPCHRVINSSGRIGGYALGKKRKRSLLDLERQIKRLML
ncbi:MAG: MGMT family protein [Candidatus Omnitrophica bacterium]|nr:MGMT family protein [Candidatus Omnitrophota bacterium]